MLGIRPSQIENAVKEGEKRFWEAMQEHFPDLKPDDLDAGTVMALAIQMQVALERVLQKAIERQDEPPSPPPALYMRRRQ